MYSVCLALTLLVAQVVADDHHAAIASDDLALVADRLDAGLNLHGSFLHRSSARGRRRDDSLVAVDDAAAGQVVRAQLHHHTVLGEDPDVVLTHLA